MSEAGMTDEEILEMVRGLIELHAAEAGPRIDQGSGNERERLRAPFAFANKPRRAGK